MAIQAIVDGDSPVNTAVPGFGYDFRPGTDPDSWSLDNVTAWPIENAPAIMTLSPAVLAPEWATTEADSGIYARDRLDHYAQGGEWEEYPRLHPKDHVFLLKQTLPIDSTGLPQTFLTSKTPLAAGSGLVVHFNAFGSQIGSGLILSVRFGHPDPAQAFWLHVREDGKAYLVRGFAHVVPSPDTLAEGNLFASRRGSLLGQWNKLFILPHGRNRILVAGGPASEGGAGFVWEDPTLSRADYPSSENPALAPRSPTGSGGGSAPLTRAGAPVTPSVPKSYPSITSQAPVAIYTAPKAAVQPRGLMYVPSGTATPKGPPLTGTLPALPAMKNIVSYPAAHPANAPEKTLVTADQHPIQWPIHITWSPPVIRANQKVITPTVAFSRASTAPDKTPVLYRFEPSAESVPQAAVKPGTDLAHDIILLRHTHDGGGDGRMTGTMRVRFGDQHADYARKFNIPFLYTETDAAGVTQTWIEAFLTEPKIELDGAQEFLEWTLVDHWRLLENMFMKAITRFDGMTITDAVKTVLILAGFPKDGSLWVIDETPATSSGQKTGQKLSKGEADDEPVNLTDAGRSCADWLKYLWETYTSSSQPPFRWVMGFWPDLVPGSDGNPDRFVTKFHFLNPEKMDRTPVKEWWPRRAEAITAGITEDQVYRSVYGKWQEEAVEPEANDINVQGLDANDTPMYAHKEDAASIKPDTALLSRPANWLGERRSFWVIDPALNTQAHVTGACQRYYNRLSRARATATFEAQWEPSVTLYKTVRIHYLDTSATMQYNDWLITGYEVEHKQDALTYHGRPVQNRPASYRCERWL